MPYGYRVLLQSGAVTCACFWFCLSQTLKFQQVSLLGWSDGGITALIAAAKYPSYIHKLVIWGANAYVTEEDEAIFQGGSHGCMSWRRPRPLPSRVPFDVS